MFFLPVSIAIFLFLIILLPILLVFLYVGVLDIAFSKLGLSPSMAMLILFLSLIGSSINIPIKRSQVVETDGEDLPEFFRNFWGISFPKIRERVLAVNFGGAIVPLLLSIYLLSKAPFLSTLIATCGVAIVAKALSKPVKGIGVTLPAFIPPIVSALFAIGIAQPNPAPCAYVSGVLGTIIGADILNLHRIERMGTGVMSIGGAGVFDGIFLVGIFAVLLT